MNKPDNLKQLDEIIKQYNSLKNENKKTGDNANLQGKSTYNPIPLPIGQVIMPADNETRKKV